MFIYYEKNGGVNYKVDLILTSPPYNNSRNNGNFNNYEKRYDTYVEKTNKEYLDFMHELFLSYDTILKENGCILFNMSYGNENAEIMFKVLSDIINNSPFTIADVIVWKKKSALPNNVSHNKLTRICEFVYVICRKSEFGTFLMNKQVKSTSRTGQKYYENIYNFVEAKNNDGKNDLNKATYSSELCEKLLSIYAKDNSIVYDSFNGTGTTGVACANIGNIKWYIGSELSEAQCNYSNERINNAIKGK